MRLKKQMTILHLFIGIGALFGGLAAILTPDRPMGISSRVLEGSPFEDFLVPGLILFGFLGLGNVLAGILTWKGSGLAGYNSIFFGGGLMIWLGVQCWILGDLVFLHVLYFVLGCIQVISGALEVKRKKQFPFSKL